MKQIIWKVGKVTSFQSPITGEWEGGNVAIAYESERSANRQHIEIHWNNGAITKHEKPNSHDFVLTIGGVPIR